jgi:membrane peptidoglycan carboxypeptidase
MGIILGGGVRSPNVRVLDLEFASGTPYETNLTRTPPAGEAVMDPAVAARLKAELIGVVESGTARRAFESVKLPDGTVLPVGGKTGTGDNRINVVAAGGQRVSSKVMNRTASFVFLVGDRFYGTVIAFVPGEKAGNFEFTSALPVQIWKTIAPRLEPLLAHAMDSAAVDATPEPATTAMEAAATSTPATAPAGSSARTPGESPGPDTQEGLPQSPPDTPSSPDDPAAPAAESEERTTTAVQVSPVTES